MHFRTSSSFSPRPVPLWPLSLRRCGRDARCQLDIKWVGAALWTCRLLCKITPRWCIVHLACDTELLRSVPLSLVFLVQTFGKTSCAQRMSLCWDDCPLRTDSQWGVAQFWQGVCSTENCPIREVSCLFLQERCKGEKKITFLKLSFTNMEELWFVSLYPPTL